MDTLFITFHLMLLIVINKLNSIYLRLFTTKMNEKFYRECLWYVKSSGKSFFFSSGNKSVILSLFVHRQYNENISLLATKMTKIWAIAQVNSFTRVDG